MTQSRCRTILLVEDDADSREAMTALLEGCGYAVTSATNGHEALELLRTAPRPGLILLDLMMPGMNGFQFREEQIKDPEAAAVPVILTSAHGKLQHETAALGVAGYLEKPIDVQRLLDTVERYCAT